MGKQIFRCRLNVAVLWHSRCSAVRVFQVDGVATLKARGARSVLVRGTTIWGSVGWPQCPCRRTSVYQVPEVRRHCCGLSVNKTHIKSWHKTYTKRKRTCALSTKSRQLMIQERRQRRESLSPKITCRPTSSSSPSILVLVHHQQ